MLTIRREIPGDIAAIRDINEQAFGQKSEADLVEKLRDRMAVTLSLVAVQAKQVVGHILFSPVTIEHGCSQFRAVGLGPMAVLPSYQRRGIGSQLVRAGIEECRQAGEKAVLVLGHPSYYPRFGFLPANTYGIRCEYDVPDELFMALELCKGALVGLNGIAKYQPEFNEG